jgi:hypothetical protein
MNKKSIKFEPPLIPPPILSAAERDGIDKFGLWRSREEFDDHNDLAFGAILFWHVMPNDLRATVDHWIGVARGVIYCYAVDRRYNGDVSVTVQLLPRSAPSGSEPESLYRFDLSASPDGRAVLELLDRVPAAQEMILDEIDRIVGRHEAAARSAILDHQAGLVPPIGIAHVELVASIQQLLEHPAYPVEQIFRSTRSRPWSTWCASALGGRFYAYDQGTSAYGYYLDDRGGVARLEEMGETTRRVSEGFFYYPVDQAEAALASARLRAQSDSGAGRTVAALLEIRARQFAMTLPEGLPETHDGVFHS